MRQKTKDALNNILSVMSGEDGGVNFLKFKMALENLDGLAETGNTQAESFINIVIEFNKLLERTNALAFGDEKG